MLRNKEELYPCRFCIVFIENYSGFFATIRKGYEAVDINVVLKFERSHKNVFSILLQ